MGAKAWMLVYSNGDIPARWSTNPAPDKHLDRELLRALFPDKKFTELESKTLADCYPDSGVVQIANLGDMVIVATDKVALDNPSKISAHLTQYKNYPYTYAFAMHSVVDWFAFAVWHKGQLQRALSVSPDSGIIEDLGEHFPFEMDYWAGKHSDLEATEELGENALQYHPLEFGEAVFLHFLGYQFEGADADFSVDPFSVSMHCYKAKPWWQFWSK